MFLCEETKGKLFKSCVIRFKGLWDHVEIYTQIIVNDIYFISMEVKRKKKHKMHERRVSAVFSCIRLQKKNYSRKDQLFNNGYSSWNINVLGLHFGGWPVHVPFEQDVGHSRP